MVKHIVMWKLKNEALGNSKQENARLIQEKLESLNGKIDGMRKIEVGIDFSLTESSFDVVLYSEFNSREDLDNYQNNPLHKALIPFILDCRSDRKIVDFEV